MIKGLSDRRRLPRAGIIRLGIMKKHPEKGTTYPEETDYFVCPQPVQDVYGEKPKELIIMFPVESEELFFRQNYKRYGYGIPLCIGDGEKARGWDFDKGGLKEMDCPCEYLKKGACGPVGILQFLLPEVKESVGVWQISTGSKNSIIDINSGIDFVRGIAGRVAMIPLLLKREPLEIPRIEGKNIKRGVHYTMKLSLAMSLMEIQRLGQIPPTQALLPPPEPDESQEAVKDLFPPNGFKEDQEKPEDEPEEEKPEEVEEGQSETDFSEDAELSDQKEELREQIARFKLMGGKINMATQKRIDGLMENGKILEIKTAIDHFKRERAGLEKK